MSKFERIILACFVLPILAILFFFVSLFLFVLFSPITVPFLMYIFYWILGCEEENYE